MIYSEMAILQYSIVQYRSFQLDQHFDTPRGLSKWQWWHYPFDPNAWETKRYRDSFLVVVVLRNCIANQNNRWTSEWNRSNKLRVSYIHVCMYNRFSRFSQKTCHCCCDGVRRDSFRVVHVHNFKVARQKINKKIRIWKHEQGIDDGQSRWGSWSELESTESY